MNTKDTRAELHAVVDKFCDGVEKGATILSLHWTANDSEGTWPDLAAIFIALPPGDLEGRHDDIRRIVKTIMREHYGEGETIQ